MSAIRGVPRLPALVIDRPRILTRLDSDTPIVVVRGPSGAGKTVAVAQWVRREAPERVLWLEASDDSSSRSGFWSLLGRRLADDGLVDTTMILASLGEALQAHDDIAPLLTRAFAELVRPLTVVIDRAELLHDQALSDLARIAAATELTRFVVLTRRRTPLEALELHSRLHIDVVSPDELMLSVDETRELIGSHADEAASVHSASGGSPFLTHMIALSLSRNPDETVDAIAADVRRAATRSVLVSLDEFGDAQLVDFASRIALADSVTAELARQLTGCADAQERLQRLEDLGFGLWSRSSSADAFTFTPLVREGLAGAFRERHPDQYEPLITLIARAALADGKPFDALRRAVEIGDFDLADEVLKRGWYRILRENALATIELFATVPMRVLMRRPLITMILALIRNANSSHKAKAAELFAMSIAASRLVRGAAPADIALLRSIESAALRVIGQQQRAASTAAKAASLLDELDVTAREELARLLPVLNNHVGISLLQGANLPAAIRRFETALGESVGEVGHFRLQPLSMLAGTRALSGDMPEALTHVEAARSRHWPDGWIDGYAGSYYQIAEALLALEGGDVDEAARRLELLDRHLPTIEHWQAITYVHTLTYLASGDAALGLAHLETVRSWHASRPAPFLQQSLIAVESQLHLALGDPARSSRVLRAAGNGPVIVLARARHALATAHPSDALAILAKAASDDLPTSRLRVEHAVLELAALLGSAQEAPHHAAMTFARLAERGLRLPLMQLPATNLAAIRELAATLPGRAAAFVASADVPAMLHTLHAVPVLTERERVILGLLRTGMSIPAIAAQLVVSPNTVKAQLRTLYRKLGVSSRDDAVARAHEYGLG